MYRELEARNFIIIEVALDTGGPDAVRKFIRPDEPIAVPAAFQAFMGWTAEEYAAAAAPTYPCLIDEKHVVGDAYDMRNVPMAVWIDEDGRIVRPAESAGASDTFRSLDRTTYTVPAEVADAGRATHARYIEAIRDWVEHGAASPYALSEDEVRARITGPSATEARATASFRLGVYLRERGAAESATRWFDEARQLSPERWTYFRQALQLKETGAASGPEFLKAVAALGDRPYYPEANL